MRYDDASHWQQWLATQGERVRLLSALQEEAIVQQQWETLNQIALEKELLLDKLWHTPPAQLPPAVLQFAQEVWQHDMRLQQMLEQHIASLHTEVSEAHRLRDRLPYYHVPPSPGSLEDRAV